MSRRRSGATAAVLLGLVLAGPASAESLFASVGFGRWLNTVDTRAAGMGDVSVVTTSPWSHAPRNPAILGGLPDASGHVSFTSDFTSSDGGAGTDTRADARVSLASFGFPLGKGFAIGAALFEMNDARYHIRQTIEGDPTYDLVSQGSGSWTQATLGLARRMDWLRLGVQVGLPFSTIDDEVTRDFADSGAYSNRTESTTTSLDEVVFTTVGVEVTPVRWPVRLGGFFQLPSEGRIESDLALFDGHARTSYLLDIPFVLGGGVGIQVGSLELVGEYRRQGWGSRAEINGVPWRDSTDLDLVRGFKDVDAWGVGLEWGRSSQEVRTRSAWSRLLWRAGYSVEPWMFAGPNFGRVVDRTTTAGVGVPFRDGNGELNIAVRYTLRDETRSDLEETVVSLLFGITYARQPRSY
jgi:hypothetical protein